MKKNNRLGEKYVTNQGYEIEIVEYFNNKNCTVKFDNGCVIIKVKYGSIKRGNVTNPLRISVFDRGFIGQGEFKSSNSGKETTYYTKWYNMFSRCYAQKQESYNNIEVCKEWYNFQNFAKWYEENWKPEFMEGWELDKDILEKGNKIYSPETCCFVPKEVNSLFIRTNKYNIAQTIDKNDGVFTPYLSRHRKTISLGRFKTYEEAFQTYKTAKEKYIKEVADKWRDKIDQRVYEAMYNYKITVDE